jgi:myo-inositol-1(or 4)-monophosphatase
MAEVAGVRRFGAAALDLAWVAAGRYDAFWERGLSPWDVAAGIVIVREAGGLVSDLASEQDMLTSGSILASNGHLHGALLKLLKGRSRT